MHFRCGYEVDSFICRAISVSDCSFNGPQPICGICRISAILNLVPSRCLFVQNFNQFKNFLVQVASFFGVISFSVQRFDVTGLFGPKLTYLQESPGALELRGAGFVLAAVRSQKGIGSARWPAARCWAAFGRKI